MFSSEQLAVLEAILAGQSLAVIGCSSSGKTTLACQGLHQKLSANNSEHECMILTSSQEQVKLLSAQISALNDFATKGFFVRSSASFAYDIANIWASNRHDCIAGVQLYSGAMQAQHIKEILVEKAEHLCTESGLDASFIDSSYFVAAVRQAVQLCEDYGVSASALTDLADDCDKPAWKVIAQVLDSFTDKAQIVSKSETKFMSVNRLERYAAQLLSYWDTQAGSNGVTADIPVPKCIIVDDFQNFTPSAIELLRTCHELGVQVVVLADPLTGVYDFRGGLSAGVYDFIKQCGLQVFKLDTAYELADCVPVLQTETAKHMFVPAEVKSAVPSTVCSDDTSAKENDSNSCDIAVFDTLENSNKYIARWIRHKYLLEGAKLQDIAVVVPQSKQVEELKADLENLNVYCDDSNFKLILSESSLVRTMLELILALDDFYNYCVQKDDFDQIQNYMNSFAEQGIAHQSSAAFADALDCFFATNPEQADNLEAKVRSLCELPLVDIDSFTVKHTLKFLAKTELDFAEDNSDIRSDIPAEQMAGIWQKASTFTQFILQTDFYHNTQLNNYFGVAVLKEFKLLQQMLLNTFKEIISSRYSIESVLWSLWDSSKKAKVWQKHVLQAGDGYNYFDQYLDTLIVLFKEAYWWTIRNTNSDIRQFCEEILNLEIENDTVAKTSIKPAGVQILTPSQTLGKKFKYLVVAGMQKNIFPMNYSFDHILSIDTLKLLLSKTIDVQEYKDKNVSEKTIISLSRKASWNTQLQLLNQIVSRSSNQILFTAVENEDTEISTFAEMIAKVMDIQIVDDSGNYIYQSPVQTLDLNSHIVQLKKTIRSYGENQRVQAKLSSLEQALQTLTKDGADIEAVKELEAKKLVLSQKLTQDIQSTDVEFESKVLKLLAKLQVEGGGYEFWYRSIPISTMEPISAVGENIYFSPSSAEDVLKCPLNWVLSSLAGAKNIKVINQQIGTLVHEIAEKYPRLHDDSGKEVIDEIRAELDKKLASLDLKDTHFDREQKRSFTQMIENYIDYIRSVESQNTDARSLESVEVEKKLAEKINDVNLTSYIDRVEKYSDDSVSLVDIKTTKVASKLSEQAVRDHWQLALYQLIYQQSATGEKLDNAQILALAFKDKEGTTFKKLLQEKIVSQTLPDETNYSFEEFYAHKFKDITEQDVVDLLQMVKKINTAPVIPLKVAKSDRDKCKVCSQVLESGDDE